MAALRRAAALGCLACAAACAGDPPGAPALLGMSPRGASGLEPVAVEVAGRGLDAKVRLDVGDGGASALDARFTARLVPWEGGAAVPLADVALASPERLTALVPAGASPGGHDLEVVDPAGRVLRLPDAFRIGPTAQDLAGFRIEPVSGQRAGAPFPVVISAVDAGGRVIEAFGGTVALRALSGATSPSSAGPFLLGTVRTLVQVGSPAAADRLSVDDGQGHTGTSNDFAVAPGPAVRLAFAGAFGASAASCTRVDLELRDAGGHATPAARDLAVRLESGPPGALLFHSDAGCSIPAAALTVAAGSTGAALHVRGAAPGTAAVRLVPAWLPTLERTVEVSP